MLKNIGSEIKIMSFILIIFLIVILTWTLAYKGLKSIVADVNHSHEPEMKLVLVKQTVSDISEAGSNIKSFNFTREPKYLSPFYNSVLTFDKNIGDLRLLTAGNSAQDKLLDQLEILTDENYTVLNQLLTLHPDENITNELIKISDKVAQENKNAGLEQKEIKEEMSTMPAELKKERRSIFKRLFGKSADESTVPETNDSAKLLKAKTETQTIRRIQKNIKGEIEKVNRQHLEERRLVKQKEFALTSQSEELMFKIREVASGIEKIEKLLIRSNIERAGERAKETNLVIALFCFIAVLLLAMVSYVLLNYLNKKRAYEKALKEGKAEAEAMAHSKEIFLANMSHEIRTPMNAIIGFTNQILKTDLNPQQREQLKIVQKTNDHLLRIINDILDFSKMQSGKFTFECVDFDPDKTVREVLELSEPLIKNKSIKINYKVSELMPELMVGDAGRLRQILLNLVSNAIKFTESGEINIKVDCTKDTAGYFTFKLIVSDTGIGIPSGRLKEIFGEFQQADDNIFFKYGGTGLGLPITKKLIELQKGSINIESEEGKGTDIIITIPYMESLSKESLPKEIERNEMEFRLDKLKVLVADDDEYNRKLLHAILVKCNVQVKEAGNGKQVVEELIKNPYDILLMDIRMPEMNGIEAAEQIRKLSDPFKAEIPIIALTAVTSEEKRLRCKQAGINDFLSKPFKEDELFKKIVSLTNKEKNELHQNNIHVRNAPVVENGINKPYNLDELKRLSNGDGKFIAEMIGVFIRTTEEGMNEIEVALAEEDYKLIADRVHKIAPPCRHMGATLLLNIFKKIENYIKSSGPVNTIKTLVPEARQELNIVITALKIEMEKI